MDSSRRAVESYWRSRMIDAATCDEDKVTPVYKLEEICDLLRSSHISVVKEVCSFILKRLDHKSPLVKQKGLRLIKYCVGKSGAEFRREMQKQSAIVRQLFHYKGDLDPLKGDALNKAVRDTAQEVIKAMFSEENKPQTQTTTGFGKNSNNYENENKSGSSSYKSPNYENEISNSISISKKTAEERLLESIVTLGGVRLTPTRDAIQAFIEQITHLDMFQLSQAIQSKLQSPHWQVRMKAVCVLDSILRRKDDQPFSLVATYFHQNKDEIVKCSESPQSSLREKANKVLSLLGGVESASENANPVVEMPDLIDTAYSDDLLKTGNSLFGDDDDPFADVSFHTNDLFTVAPDTFELFDIFGSNKEQQTDKSQLEDLMGVLSINEETSDSNRHQSSNDFIQTNTNFMFPPFNQGQQINFGAMGNLFAQIPTGGGYSGALPDIFQQNFPTQVPNPTSNTSKKEETKAFDFISDHLAAARDPKRSG